jgi:hypothetical protein
LKIRFLGTHNAESKNTRLVSLLIDDIIAIDTGSLVSELTLKEQEKIKAILLTPAIIRLMFMLHQKHLKYFHLILLMV